MNSRITTLKSSLRAIMKPPNATYLLGSDDLGRDVLSRLIFASRLSLIASVQAVVIALGLVVLASSLALAGYLLTRIAWRTYLIHHWRKRRQR